MQITCIPTQYRVQKSVQELHLQDMDRVLIRTIGKLETFRQQLYFAERHPLIVCRHGRRYLSVIVGFVSKKYG